MSMSICPKCRSTNWKVNATDGMPTNSMFCADCGYQGTFPIVDKVIKKQKKKK